MTQVDTRLEDRSDWARPADPNAKHAIEKMMEECLVDVPVSPIEDHRAAATLAVPQGPAPRPARARKLLLFAVAAAVAALAAAWLLLS